MKRKFQDAVCHTDQAELYGSRPTRPGIYPVAVYQCDSPEQANRRLGGEEAGYVYQRNAHPNADVLAEKLRNLHAADHAVVTNSGQAAIAMAMLTTLNPGDHVLLSNRLYGGTSSFARTESSRLGITTSKVEACDLDTVRNAIVPETKMIVVETISNPLLRVCDLASLSNIAHENGAILVVDNTFASPMLCRPLDLGADLVIESMTKLMNGHGDVIMGLLCGKDGAWGDAYSLLVDWGWTTSPMDCWLVDRGLSTLHVRQQTACRNAKEIAQQAVQLPGVERVDFPGLADHQDHQMAVQQFSQFNDDHLFGNMVSIHLSGGAESARRFIASSSAIPFCPSLGELITTLSHPATTSHRGLTPEERAALGISDGTVRLSIGLESPEFILDAVKESLAG